MPKPLEKDLPGMNDFLEFISLSNPNVRYVVISSVLLGISASVVGVFAFLKKNSLVGETVAHSMLPGIGLAFILSGSRDPIVLIIGAVVAAWVSLLFMEWISKIRPIKRDMALAITLTGFFGIGIMLMTHIQRGGYGDHSGLDHYIFGNVAAMTKNDAFVFSGLAVFVLVVLTIAYKEMKMVSFNADYAQSKGIPTRLMEIGMSSLNILAIAGGIKAVGIVLMAALLIIPAAAARYWAREMRSLIVLSAIFGAIAGIFGSYFSFQRSGMPTGPLIVVVLALATAVSVILAPNKGLLARRRKRARRGNKMLAENLVKRLYQKGEKNNEFEKFVAYAEVREELCLKRKDFYKSLRLSIAYGWIIPRMGELRLTKKGTEVGHTVNRLHRLWEIYMARRAGTPLEFVHETAEVMEHLLTPELEQEIKEELGLCDNFDPKSEIHQVAS